MRRTVARLILVMTITAIGLVGADTSLGTWKRNIAKSTPSTPNPITCLTMVIEAYDGGIRTTMTGERKDGTAYNSSYTAKYDGKEYPVTGATANTISIKQIDANTFAFDTKKTGVKYHVTGRTVISKDGKTMTTTGKGVDDAGKPLSLTIVYDKK